MRAIGNRPCNEVCIGVIGAGRVEFTYLFGVKQSGYVCKCVSQTTARKKVCEVLKGFIGCLIFEGGDETNIVCDKENGSIGGVGSFNDTERSFVRVDDARSHCCRAVADEGFWGRR